jgi:maltoporin
MSIAKEILMKTKSMQTVMLGACTLISSHAVFALDYNGYFRANTGSNSADGGQVCFGLAGADSKYRLGNECGVYGELTLGNEIVKTDDGSVFRGTVMFSYENSVAGDSSLTNNNGNIGWAQVYLSAENVPELGGATAWMGRRYYKREDLHITDFFYWNPASNQGLGAGIEDLPIGDNGLKFSYALFRDDSLKSIPKLDPTTNESNGMSETRHDFQLRGLGVNDGGSLEFGLSVIAKDSKVDNTNGGYMFTVQHRQSGVFGDGENKLAIQYGSGAGAGSNGGAGDLSYGSDVHQIRIVEGLYSQLTNRLGGQLVAVYDKISADAPETARVWTTFGGRVAYGITPHIKFLADLGHDSVKHDGGPKANLTKFTLSAALSAGPGYYSRPELRLFYTHASWNDAASALADAGDPLSTTGVFGTDTNGSVIGLTAEAWW